ncbi:hypothetical protein ES703_55000 [subsurface metagenome]
MFPSQVNSFVTQTTTRLASSGRFTATAWTPSRAPLIETGGCPACASTLFRNSARIADCRRLLYQRESSASSITIPPLALNASTFSRSSFVRTPGATRTSTLYPSSSLFAICSSVTTLIGAPMRFSAWKLCQHGTISFRYIFSWSVR